MMDGSKVLLALGFLAAFMLTVQSVAKIIVARVQSRVSARLSFRGDREDRLERIEAAVDAIAVEVERIAEAQRYSLRLEEQRDAQRLPRLGGESRSITPH